VRHAESFIRASPPPTSAPPNRQYANLKVILIGSLTKDSGALTALKALLIARQAG